MFTYEFKPQAFRELKKLPKEVQKKLIKKLDYFISAESPLSFADKLIHFEIGSFRFRIGDYRVIFDIEGEKIIVLAVGDRKEIYK